MHINLLESGDYREFINHKIRENKGFHGYRAILAKAAGCQSAYFSQVMKSRAQLTPDQAAGLCKYWRLNDVEAQGFMLLVYLGRAGTPELKSMLLSQLAELKRQQLDLSKRFQKPKSVRSDLESLYYSSWHWAAIHILCGIPGYEQARAIAKRLELPDELVYQGLCTLEKMDLVKRVGSGWSISGTGVHLPKTSPFTFMNHTMWRMRVMSRLQSDDETSIHYTAIFSLAKKDVEALNELIIQFLKEKRKFIGDSGKEDLYGFTCDFFKV